MKAAAKAAEAKTYSEVAAATNFQSSLLPYPLQPLQVGQGDNVPPPPPPQTPTAEAPHVRTAPALPHIPAPKVRMDSPAPRSAPPSAPSLGLAQVTPPPRVTATVQPTRMLRPRLLQPQQQRRAPAPVPPVPRFQPRSFYGTQVRKMNV